MEKELKEWMEKYDKKLRAMGFVFEEVHDYGISSEVHYKKQFTSGYYAISNDKNIPNNYILDLIVKYLKDQNKIEISLELYSAYNVTFKRSFEYLTTERAFELVDDIFKEFKLIK